MAWHALTIESEALRGNPLGDPHERSLFVWTPDDQSETYPTVYVLHAHMRAARSWFNVEPFEKSYPDLIDELAPAANVVLVDGWTSVGGSQWIDSAGIGSYATYLCDEVVPFVEARFPANGSRALQGKSSGGYGAIVNALARPDLFHAIAAHAPDALFEVTLVHGFPEAARALRSGATGDFSAELAHSLALAFSNGELPFDPETAVLRPAVWERWLDRDPVRIVQRQPEAATALRASWLDVGDADEYFADLGVLALRRAFEEVGADLRFELFPGGHRGVSWRYPLSLEFLVGSLSITL